MVLLKMRPMTPVINFRKQIEEILRGQTHKKALVVGPCSIHHIEQTLVYAKKLKALADRVDDHLLIVMRVFLEKPRTQHHWRGFMIDPDLDGRCDLNKGIRLSKELLCQLNDLNLPLATEFIDPNLAPFIADHISWGFIGARTMRSPLHRQLASFLPMPIGFKNPLDGDLTALEQAIDVASHPHVALIPNNQGYLELKRSEGNPMCHGVLRGSSQGSNIQNAQQYLNPLIIDCAHGNSSKTLHGMTNAFDHTLSLLIHHPHIKGLMLESFLESGSQPITHTLVDGISVTDPCLSFETTQELIFTFYRLLSQSQGSSSPITGSSLRSTSSSEMLISGVKS
jgi:3-deoxy-7-phosphoheptulonate synthase